MTLDELIRELTDTPGDFASRDRIEIAVQHLARTGLLYRHGQFVLPTRALLRALELMDTSQEACPMQAICRGGGAISPSPRS